jgi:hypothetical protein
MMSATVDIGLVQILQCASFDGPRPRSRVLTMRFAVYLQTLPGMAWVRDLPTQRQRLMRATYAVLERSSQRIIAEKVRLSRLREHAVRLLTLQPPLARGHCGGAERGRRREREAG